MKNYMLSMNRMLMIVFIFSTGFLLSCGGMVRSGLGESCTKTNDCQDGLLCIDLKCVSVGDAMDKDAINGDTASDVAITEDTLNADTASDVAITEDTLNADVITQDTTSEDIKTDETSGDTVLIDGTWKDPISGLTWQNPPSEFRMKWQAAINYCDNLVIGIYDDWRLPTISELRTLFRGCPVTITGGECGVTDSCLDSPSCYSTICMGCDSNAGPTNGCYWPEGLEGLCDDYWSSSSRPDTTNHVWVVFFFNAQVSANLKDNIDLVRCVR